MEQINTDLACVYQSPHTNQHLEKRGGDVLEEDFILLKKVKLIYAIQYSKNKITERKR